MHAAFNAAIVLEDEELPAEGLKGEVGNGGARTEGNDGKGEAKTERKLVKGRGKKNRKRATKQKHESEGGKPELKVEDGETPLGRAGEISRKGKQGPARKERVEMVGDIQENAADRTTRSGSEGNRRRGIDLQNENAKVDTRSSDELEEGKIWEFGDARLQNLELAAVESADGGAAPLQKKIRDADWEGEVQIMEHTRRVLSMHTEERGNLEQRGEGLELHVEARCGLEKAAKPEEPAQRVERELGPLQEKGKKGVVSLSSRLILVIFVLGACNTGRRRRFSG
jgi:hypothetical protein